MELILKYFPKLTDEQIGKLTKFKELFTEWNSKINLVSRKDIENLEERHILHSLAIGKVINFVPGTEIMDVGTGGGLPGLPLAILFPEVQFTLVDSIGKKIKAVEEMAREIGLDNVRTLNSRAENVPQQFDFVTGRAVTDIGTFYKWVKEKIKKKGINGLPNGILYIKGGDLRTEVAPFGKRVQIYSLTDFYQEEFFETKSVVYIESAGR